MKTKDPNKIVQLFVEAVVGAVDAAMDRSLTLVENRAKESCPVDTGVLRASLTSEKYSEDVRITGRVGTPIRYAAFVEYGTGLNIDPTSGYTTSAKKIPWVYRREDGKFVTTYGNYPHPFLRPALNENRVRIQEIFNEELARAQK